MIGSRFSTVLYATLRDAALRSSMLLCATLHLAHSQRSMGPVRFAAPRVSALRCSTLLYALYSLARYARACTTARLHFCQPHGGPKKQPESLGSILWGDRIYNSPFQVEMLRK